MKRMWMMIIRYNGVIVGNMVDIVIADVIVVPTTTSENRQGKKGGWVVGICPRCLARWRQIFDHVSVCVCVCGATRVWVLLCFGGSSAECMFDAQKVSFVWTHATRTRTQHGHAVL